MSPVTVVNSFTDLRGNGADVKKALVTLFEKMTDIFLWEGLNYKVPIGGGVEGSC